MYSRHDLIWLTPGGWDVAHAQAQPADGDALDRWRRAGWPAVVRRNDVGLAAGSVCLGIALPPNPRDGKKRKIALTMLANQVERHSPPLPLAHALLAAPQAWREALEELAGHASLCGLRVYGSLALQAITGQRYLSDTSDIDLLFLPASALQLEDGMEWLAAYAERLPLDGEIIFPTGEAVAWKEWRAATQSQSRVLVKSIDAVRLEHAASLVAPLESA